MGKWYENSIGKPADYGPAAFRGLSIHEALHALGWNINDLQTADAVAGPFKSYTEPGEKGLSDDALWYVKPSTRSATLAKVHFDCQDESKWRGYPLMGIIEGGRDSHHNGHIFWEDVESYGSGDLITPITLALMEDLGVYLADYTKSTLPNLGAFAGCDFVNTRCRHQDENGITDQTYETVASTEECEGWVNKWNGGGFKSYLLNQDFRLNKCNNDYRTKCGSVNKCHPECIIKTADNGKEYNKWRPLGNATGALPAIYPTKTLKEKNRGRFNAFIPLTVISIYIVLICSRYNIQNMPFTLRFREENGMLVSFDLVVICCIWYSHNCHSYLRNCQHRRIWSLFKLRSSWCICCIWRYNIIIWRRTIQNSKDNTPFVYIYSWFSELCSVNCAISSSCIFTLLCP